VVSSGPEAEAEAVTVADSELPVSQGTVSVTSMVVVSSSHGSKLVVVVVAKLE
jgi:hypothetical protein